MDILSAAKRYRMFSAGDRVLVAVSGGPDSIAMLHALHAHSNEFGISLHVAHLNHGIRGEAADRDAEFVREFAHGLGLESTIEKVDVPALRKEMHLGEEEAARVLRYKFLRKTASNIGAQKIALGHNADDRAESVLFNVIRGTGVDGLGSIRPVRGDIVRPLIDTHRSEIEAYVTEHGLEFRIDESNFDTTYTRNRVRHELIPLLEEHYNPQVRAALVRLAEIAAMDSDFIESAGASALGTVVYRGAIDVERFLQLHPAVQYEILRLEILGQKGDLKDVAFEQVQRVIHALNAGGDFKITLPSGRIYALRRGAEFRIEPKAEPARAAPFDHIIEVPGTTRIPEVSLTLEADVLEGAVMQKPPPHVALIDYDAVVGPLRVRSVEPGDRIRPFGMKGSKKLQDVFVDKKIPRRERARAAVVVDDQKVLWVVGVVSSEAGRVTADTRRVIRLRAARDQ